MTIVNPPSEGYRLDELIIQNDSGEVLSSIPKTGGFWVSVPVTKVSAGAKDACILLASYTGENRFGGMMSARVSNLPQDVPVTFSYYIKDAGSIFKVKAFVISSLSDLRPLGEAVSFPAD